MTTLGKSYGANIITYVLMPLLYGCLMQAGFPFIQVPLSWLDAFGCLPLHFVALGWDLGCLPLPFVVLGQDLGCLLLPFVALGWDLGRLPLSLHCDL